MPSKIDFLNKKLFYFKNKPFLYLGSIHPSITIVNLVMLELSYQSQTLKKSNANWKYYT